MGSRFHTGIFKLLRHVLLLALAGCASMQPVRDPTRFISESAPAMVYVTHVNGANLTISQPRVSGDSLIGIWQGAAQPLALPLQELRRIEAVQRSTSRTIVLVSTVAVVGAAMGYMLTRAPADERQPCNFEDGHHAGGCDIDDP